MPALDVLSADRLRGLALAQLRTRPAFAQVAVDHETLAGEVARASAGLSEVLYPQILDLTRIRGTRRRDALEAAVLVASAAGACLVVWQRRAPWLLELGAVADPLFLTGVVLGLLGTASIAAWAPARRRWRRRDAEHRLAAALDAEVAALIRQAVTRHAQPGGEISEYFDEAAAPVPVGRRDFAAIQTETLRRLRQFVECRDARLIALVGPPGCGRTTLLEMLLRPSYAGVRLDAPGSRTELIQRTYAALVAAAGPRRRLPGRPDTLARLLRRNRALLDGNRTVTNRVGLSPAGATAERNVVTAERERTDADWLDLLRTFVVDLHRDTGKHVVICVELSELVADAEMTAQAVDVLRQLCAMPDVSAFLSVTTGMLRDRGPSKRAVEEMIRRYTERVDVPALSLPDARTLLARRMSGFPPLAALFCHAWSGGNPRDLLRVAEACIDQRRAAGGSPAVPGVADRVLRADLAGRAAAARDEHPGDFGWSGLRTGLDAAPATYDRLPAPPGELGGLLLVAAHLSRHLASPPAPGTSVQAVETLAEARRAARDQSRDEVATILARLPEPGERTPQP